jgi:hypothetical protein
MKEWTFDIIKWGLIVLIAALAFNFTNRYLIVGASPGAYKIDKLTGQTWFVAGSKEVVVKSK